MAVDGMWSMSDDGEFTLSEPYKTMLNEAKLTATKGWRDGLLGYLEPRCVYDAAFLSQELLRRVDEQGVTPMEMLDEFVLEALGGDL